MPHHHGKEEKRKNSSDILLIYLKIHSQAREIDKKKYFFFSPRPKFRVDEICRQQSDDDNESFACGVAREREREEGKKGSV